MKRQNFCKGHIMFVDYVKSILSFPKSEPHRNADFRRTFIISQKTHSSIYLKNKFNICIYNECRFFCCLSGQIHFKNLFQILSRVPGRIESHEATPLGYVTA
ncbi:hypothetical protein BIW11_09174, partial [Tropilaelaps mercedesae]